METKVPELVPRPREVRSAEGMVELGKEVKLDTEGLSEERSRVVVEILGGVGVQTDGGGGFSIEIKVVGGTAEGVPGDVQDEYYELELSSEGASIRAMSEDGALWGAHRLADLYRAASLGKAIPALVIRDWPDLANRGIFVENKWGPDRMSREDWYGTIDRLASLRMNRMGVGLYGCWGNCRYEVGPKGLGWPTEFLMARVPDHPELKSAKRLRWYSPQASKWRDETYLPTIFEEDFLGDLVAYGRERGVTVIPFVNSLGHNTMIPRLLPEVSAKDEDGKPLSIGYCLSNPKTREFIEGFYGSVVDRYYAGKADFFHIQMDEVWADNTDPDEPHVRSEPWCQCADCRPQEREELLQDYVLWLVEMLTRRGVDKVVMWNDQLTRHMDALDESFAGKLEEKGLVDRLILHWWWYSNDELNDKTRVSIGRKLGLPGWVAPMTCYFNWQMYSPRLKNIELMLEMARDEGGEGAVSYSVHDPGWTDHEMLLASYAWNTAAIGKWEDEVEFWAKARFGENASRFLEAIGGLREAAATPGLGSCYHYTYTYVRPNLPFPREYPGEALEGLADVDGVGERLESAAQTARKAASGFAGLASSCEGEDRVMLMSLQGEAARIEGIAKTFAGLLAVWRETREAEAVEDGKAFWEKVIWGLRRIDLVQSMAIIEGSKPRWVVPSTLQALSALLEFCEQLKRDVNEVARERRKIGDIRWTVGKGDGA